MQYSYITNKIYDIYKELESELAEALSIAFGVPKTEQPVAGYSGAYSKMFFNYATILLYDKMLEERGDEPTFDDEVDDVLDELAELRSTTRDVLDRYIDNEEENKLGFEKIYKADDAPTCISDAIEQAEDEINNFFNEL